MTEEDRERLASGEPLAYVIGWVPFLSVRVSLHSKPLIPRPETEWWTEILIQHLKNTTIYGSVSDAQITEILRKVQPMENTREWYWALMDYGAYLKKSGVRLNSKAKGYTKQSKFEGSDREVRGAIVRLLAQGPASAKALAGIFLNERSEQVRAQLTKLEKEGMVVKRARQYALPL